MKRLLCLAIMIIVSLSGCASQAPRSTASAPSSCPISVPSVRATVGSTGVVCPSQLISSHNTQGGYGQALYIIPPSGSMRVMTHGGGEQLVLLSVQYLEILDNGSHRTAVVYFDPATAYTVQPLTCSGPVGQHVSAQPVSLFAYVPEAPVLHPALLATGEAVGGNGVINALDPSFGLKSYTELADALCALP